MTWGWCDSNRDPPTLLSDSELECVDNETCSPAVSGAWIGNKSYRIEEKDRTSHVNHTADELNQNEQAEKVWRVQKYAAMEQKVRPWISFECAIVAKQNSPSRHIMKLNQFTKLNANIRWVWSGDFIQFPNWSDEMLVKCLMLFTNPNEKCQKCIIYEQIKWSSCSAK